LLTNNFPVAAAAAAVLSFTPDARADLLLAPARDGTSVLHEEVATTFGAPRVTRWSRLSVATTHGRFAWLVEVTGPSRVDLAGEAWLSSLETASAARVVPPFGAAPCDASLTPEIARWPIAGTLAYPADARILGNDAALSDYSKTLGLDASDATATAHSTFSEGGAFVALFFDAGIGTARTPTVRVSGTGGPAIGLGLGAGHTTSYAIGPAPAAFSGAPVLVDANALTWGAYGSNYEAVRLQSIIVGGPGNFLVESARPSLFMTTIDDAVSVPSVASNYFGADACGFAAESLDDEPVTVSTTCAAGALATVGFDACDESVSAAEVDAHALRCGGDDFALALSGAIPSHMFLTRALSYGDRDATIAHASHGTTTEVRAARWDSSCVAVGIDHGSAGGGGGGGGGSWGGGGNAGGGVDVTGEIDLGAPGPDAEADPSGDSCDGSSADSSSDTSSDTGSSDGCDSSSSDTSSSGGDGCSGDSGGGGGDGCSGGGGDLGGGGGDCSVARRGARAHGRGHGRRSSPVSRVVLGAAMVLLFWRRRSRVSEALASARNDRPSFRTSSGC
jgi:hypothetical protein